VRGNPLSRDQTCAFAVCVREREGELESSKARGRARELKKGGGGADSRFKFVCASCFLVCVYVCSECSFCTTR
jgi:hypothetical protein